MAEKKSVAKSIRLTPELYDFINNYSGNGFNEKFSNIISFCFEEEKNIRQRIKQQQQELSRLHDEITSKRKLLQTLQNLEWAIDRATSFVTDLPAQEPEKGKNVAGQEQFF